MNMVVLSLIYVILLMGVTIFSWGFVDANIPIRTLPFLYDLVIRHRSTAAALYVALQLLLFVWYTVVLISVYKQRIRKDAVITLVGLSIGILFFFFPGFSFDIFNYIATAKVAYLWRENPYLVMPIEIPNEPILTFLHASNKVALYGPAWILLTAIPHYLGMNNLLFTVFMFKALVIAFYAGLAWLIFRISKSTFSLAFFALNPLVTIETLGNGHNDAVMMFLALLSFYWLEKKRYIGSILVLTFSILIKYATIFLLPIYIYSLFSSTYLKIVNAKRLWAWCAMAMYFIFFLSPLREEIYAWYLIWPLTFVALVKPRSFLQIISLGFSFGLPLRFAPFIYLRNWGGITPLMKKLVTFIPPILAGFAYGIRKKI